MAEQVLELSVEQQRSIASTGLMGDPTGLKQRGTDPKHIAYLDQLIASHQRIEMLGEQPATIVSLNPYTLRVNHPLFDGIVVAAVKPGESYSAHVLQKVEYQVNPGMDRNHTPVEFWPIQLAKEFETQYAEKGGVFVIKGDLKKNPELELTAEFKTKMHAAREQQFGYCFKLYNEANNAWNASDRGLRRNIHNTHRQAARILLDARKIAKKPEWLDTLIATDEIVPACVCGAEPKKGALICGTCGYILNPALAFERNIISEQHESLERLTREEVEKLGISAFVAETSDEAPARRKAGKPKPQSRFELQQIKAREKELADEAKAAGARQSGKQEEPKQQKETEAKS